MHVGDLLRTDAGAKAARITTIWVWSPYQDEESDAEPDYVIDSLHELSRVFRGA